MQAKSACSAVWPAAKSSSEVFQRLDTRSNVRRILQQTNRSEAPRASRQTRSAIGKRDPSNGDHGNGNGATNFLQTLKSLGSAMSRFRGSGEDRTKKNVVSTAGCGGFRRFQRVAGNSNQKVLLRAMRNHKPPHFLNRQAVFTQMHAARPFRERDVQAVVDKNSSSRGIAIGSLCRTFQCVTREQRAFPPAKILLPNLNPIHTGKRRRFNAVQERVT